MLAEKHGLPFGMDRRTSLQSPRLRVRPPARSGACRRRHEEDPSRARRRGAADPSIHFMSPPNGRRSTSFPAAASISLRAAVMTATNSRRSTRISSSPPSIHRSPRILNKCWTEPGKFSFEGKFYQAHDIEVFPRPLRNPSVPTWPRSRKFRCRWPRVFDWNLLLAPFASTIQSSSAASAMRFRPIANLRTQNAPVRKVKSSYSSTSAAAMPTCRKPRRAW